MESQLSKKLQVLASISADYSHIEDSCLMVHFDSDLSRHMGEVVMPRSSVEGMICILISKGAMEVEINSERYSIIEPSILSAHQGTLVHLTSPDWSEVDAYMLHLSPEFLQDINISFSAISGETLLSRPSPVLALRDRELSVLMRYFKLIHAVMSDNFNNQLNRHMVSNIMAAFFYQNVAILYKRLDNNYPERPGLQRNNYVHEFMKLVHLHYTKERSVSFYASRLFISPKYLSLLVKEATGRSAARWIDYFVINEAKNLLRFSGKNIQQVAYALNFSNQSSFGKYFKHLTGMSPTEFQKN